MNKKVGQINIKVTQVLWQECAKCEKPAKYRISFLLEHFRTNPQSSAYGKDDCTWCSDMDTYACEEHKEKLSNAPFGYCSVSVFPLKNFKHLGFYESKIEPDMYKWYKSRIDRALQTVFPA